jgi:hypothetical protein
MLDKRTPVTLGLGIDAEITGSTYENGNDATKASSTQEVCATG